MELHQPGNKREHVIVLRNAFALLSWSVCFGERPEPNHKNLWFHSLLQLVEVHYIVLPVVSQFLD